MTVVENWMLKPGNQHYNSISTSTTIKKKKIY